MKIKKLISSIVLAVGMTIGAIAQTAPTYVPIPSDYTDSLHLIKQGGNYLPAGEIADGWVYTWDKININYIKIHNRLNAVEGEGGTALTQEQVEDYVGAMFTGNTETDITMTYQDADGTIDAVVTLDTTGLSQRITEDSTRIDAIEAGGNNGVYTFSNGLAEATGAVTLGGALTANTTFTGATYDFNLGTSGTNIDEFEVWADNIIQINTTTAAGTIILSHNSDGKWLDISSTGMVVGDSDDSQGLVYDDDYSANSTARSLVDSAQVAAMIAADTLGLSVRIGEDSARIDSIVAVLGDTTVGYTLYHTLTDTLQFVGGWGDGLDSTGCNINARLGMFNVVQDNVVLDSTRIRCTGTGGSVTVQWKYGDWSTAGTGLHTAIPVTTAGGWAGTSTFSTGTVPIGNDIWGIITAKDYGCTAIRAILFYHETRN